MRIPRVYTSSPLTVGLELELDAGAVRHLCQVLRLQTGAAIQLFNGDGKAYDAQLSETSKRRARAHISGVCEGDSTESPLYTHLGIAVSKGERMDWVLQKATELGVSRITPLLSRRVEVRLNAERQNKKHQHWQQVIISACEQCGRNRLPQLDLALTLEQWLPDVDCERRLLLSPHSKSGLDPSAAPKSVALLIGAEGGLDAEEVELARRHDFTDLSLGPRVLRTETAPLAALVLAQHCWGDM